MRSQVTPTADDADRPVAGGEGAVGDQPGSAVVLGLTLARGQTALERHEQTVGHERGTMGIRWVRADSHPEPSCSVVSLASLRGESE